MRGAIPIPTRRTHNASSDNRAFKPPDHWTSRTASMCGADRPRGGVQSSDGRNRSTEKVDYLPPNFVVELRGERGVKSDDEARALVEKCKSKAEGFRWFRGGRGVALELYFTEWMQALEGTVSMWELRFDGLHNWTPAVVSKVLLPSDVVELDERLKILFCERVEGLVKGEVVGRWEKRMECVLDNIARLAKKMKKRFYSLAVHKELSTEMAGLKEERQLVSQRLREFRAAMECVIGYLQGKSDVGKVFKFDGHFDWGRIYQLIMREVKRLEDGLPIYSFRQEILRIVEVQQVMVLIGETGSGKSTQLVQFLVDAGLVANGSIVCTQPRKIAATSLARRVNEEVSGCYKDIPITSCQTYEPSREIKSSVIFMTDHCLLQHYMRDRNLYGITSIIVDEAHERSLNTDILLALLKDLLCRRTDMRLIIMSATADAKQLSEYLFGCAIFAVPGRHFPVDVRYVPSTSESILDPGGVSSYASDVVRMAGEIHRSQNEGTILAFLTSPMEVEWACEKFVASSSIALPLHGKLSYEEQFRVYLSYAGQRKVIFATNIAETSLTIPGVRYVIDCGMAKESKFDPGTGMNVVKVCRISQSAANQRTGRAGRTEPGMCYRLYSKSDFDQMLCHQEPEICRVHLGIAVLRIIALGVKDIKSFDFVDAPSSESIEMAIRNLIHLGAVVEKNGILELTDDGRCFVKLGIEPRLGKLLMGCFHYDLRREGVVLAAVMANANSIFCRVGNAENKLKADSIKVQFCHQNGDLFTLLSVYKEWESVPRESRKKWCWDNSINGKSMRRCEDTVLELENCVRHELSIVVPTRWDWNPYAPTQHDKHLKNVLLHSLSENVAVYSGCNLLGYEVALTGQYVQLHPSCSLLVFGHNPNWVVFGDLVSTSSQYLTCVSAINFDDLSTLYPPPLFSVSKLLSRKLEMHVFDGFGTTVLKKFCGKFNSNMRRLLSSLRADFNDDRIRIQVNVDENQILVFASSKDLPRVSDSVKDAVEHERKILVNECMEKRLYDDGHGSFPSVALFGAGAEIKHLELNKRTLSVDLSFMNLNIISDKELLLFLERFTSGTICAIHKNAGQESEKSSRLWGRITFLTPDAAEKAVELNRVEYAGALLKVDPSHKVFGGDNKMFQFPSVRARIHWPRRRSKGVAIVKYDVMDAMSIIDGFHNLVIGGKLVRCDLSRKSANSIVIFGIDTEISEAEVLDALRQVNDLRILDFFLVRGDAVESPSSGLSEEAILREISPFLPKKIPRSHCCRVKVFPPEPRDVFMSAIITFDGRLHLEAAKALESIEGRVLPGCLPWQMIKCQPVFNSFVSCPASVYHVIKHQLDALLADFNNWKGVECGLSWNNNGSCRVKISANATKIVAEVRRPLEQLMQGKTLTHPSLSPAILQHLFSRDGVSLMKTIQEETGTFIFFDKYSTTVKVFGTEDKITIAEERLTRSLVEIHKNKKLEIYLRGASRPPDLMKEVVKRFGPDLQGLKEKVPDADLSLNIRHHIIYVGGGVEMKQQVEEAIFSIVEAGGLSSDIGHNEVTCPICLCELEDAYRLEYCGHRFCQACLVEQCESAIRSQDSFPMRCTEKGCQALIVMSDLRSLLANEKLDELFESSLGSFVASSGGAYRFCPSPDCPSVYRAADPSDPTAPGFACGACLVETCTRCHLEFHPNISCEQYKEFKADPDSSLKEWCRGKEDHVKTCPTCCRVIEKSEGCNHIECRCGAHICWACLATFSSSEDCYHHLRSVHQTII
uniref:RNA helicase n=1 Tax=Kalanchoe fedtschenkoi TaxID=63787 RepID=A0A7N0TIA9_KALFE